MKLYSVTNGYIDYLRAEHPHVYSNKENESVHSRKYIGTVIEINRYRYFIPLSSPKEDDYEIKDGLTVIRKDSFLIWRIVSKKEGTAQLKATIRIANMIPVPKSELLLYDIENEPDEKYRDLIEEEQEYIRKRGSKLIKRASIVYKNKINNNPNYVYKYCLDYKDMERMHDEWLSYVSNSYEED